jgi:hypothetical protein
MNTWIIIDAGQTDRCIFPALTHPDWQLWVNCDDDLATLAGMAIAMRIRDAGGADAGAVYTCYIHHEGKHRKHEDGSIAQVFVSQCRVREEIALGTLGHAEPHEIAAFCD